MKASILLSVFLVTALLFGSANNASAHRGYHHCGARVVRVYEAPVEYERPVVRYVHGRYYHPTPYCSEPVMIRREHWDGPWYYVGHDHHDHFHGDYRGDYRGGYCHNGNCRR